MDLLESRYRRLNSDNNNKTFFLISLSYLQMVLKSVRVHFAYGSDGWSFFVEYS